MGSQPTALFRTVQREGCPSNSAVGDAPGQVITMLARSYTDPQVQKIPSLVF